MTEWVICRPMFDEASKFSFQFCEQIIKFLKEKGIFYTDFSEVNATRRNVEDALKKDEDANLCFFNHGDREGLVQQDGEGYIIDKKNDDNLKGREVYTLACLWGADGGIDAWKKGAKAVWCYTQVVSFTTEALSEFETFFVAGFKFKLEGKTWEESLQLAKNLAKELCQKLIETGKYISAVILQQDADALRCYTQNNPPETKCLLRKAMLKIFGSKVGWKITRKHALGWIFYLVGFGISLHDFSHNLWELKGTVLSLEGGYVGFALSFIGFIFLVSDYVKWLKRNV